MCSQIDFKDRNSCLIQLRKYHDYQKVDKVMIMMFILSNGLRTLWVLVNANGCDTRHMYNELNYYQTAASEDIKILYLAAFID